MAEPEEYQEAHSPTEPYEIVISKATRRTTHVARRRKQDCRLWDGMTSEMESAAEAIVRAVYVISGQASYARSSFERVDRSHPADTSVSYLQGLVEAYNSWVDDAEERGVIVGAVLKVLYHGASLRETDRSWKRRNGWAKEQVDRGLELYLSLTWRARIAEGVKT